MASFVFTVDSALLSELGEKLVANVHVALTELVKNAYDADAKTASVTIQPQENRGPKIRIKDDGIGMTRKQVIDFWMKIGTANKVAAPRSELYGRPKTGAKGIGRFCCRRLGRKLKLTTCALVVRLNKKGKEVSRSYETTIIDFDWDRFEPGKDVEDVVLTGQTNRYADGQVGTILEIWDAPLDEWQQRGFN
jgi:hypothetical protein